MQDLGPLMILPTTGSTQTRAMGFFEQISIKHLNEYHPCDSWRKTLMYFSQTVPSVRHAATALALIQRRYMDQDSCGLVQPSSFEGWLPDKTPLLHYNRAIELLLNQESGDSLQTTAVTLLVCYLFTCFDHLACNYVQALKHLRGGVELSRSINKTMKDNSSIHDARFSEFRTLICHLTRQIRRLDMQAVMFLVDWTPADLHETFTSQLSSHGGAFESLEQAADQLQILTSRVMGLRNAEQETSSMSLISQPSYSLRESISSRLENWLSLFETTLQQTCSYQTDPGANPLVSLLRLHYTMARILVGTHATGREMDYDELLPQFQRCLALADEVAIAHDSYSGSPKPKFTPEIGIIPVLYMIGAKCRHPTVRREVVDLLRRQSIREAVWDSISTARVLERIIEIEEGEPVEGGTIRTMEQIAAWQRIETLSWVQVVGGQSIGRLDLTYTFCAREATYTESLAI